MNRVSISSTARSKQRDETGRLQGRWLVFVRIVWLLVAALAVGLFGAGLPFYFAHLQIPCVGADACAVNGALSLANMRTLQGLGISVSSYSVYLLPFSYSNVREHSRAVSSSCFIVDSHGTGTFGSALPFRSHINSPGILRPAVATLQDGQLYA